jgi:hypothetical protein
MTDRGRTVVPPDDLRAFALERIETVGAARASAELGMSRHALTSIASGARVFRGTVLVMREAIREREAGAA